MGDFNRGSRYAGKGGGNFRKRDFDDDRGDNRGGYSNRGGSRPPLHKAVCNKCGNDCEVPFRPTGDRPVFCNDCFKREDGFRAPRDDRRESGKFNQDRDSRPRFDNRPSQTSSSSGNAEINKALLEQMNKTLSEILRVLSGKSNNQPEKTIAVENKSKKEVDTNAVNELVASALKPKNKKKAAKKGVKK